MAVKEMDEFSDCSSFGDDLVGDFSEKRRQSKVGFHNPRVWPPVKSLQHGFR